MTRFGPFELRDGALSRDGKPVAVGQRGLALLEALAVADGAVTKAALMEAGWPGTIVEEGNLTVQVAALRKALGPRADGQEWIVTVPRVGYRLLRGEVKAAEAAEPVRLPTLAVLPFQNLGGDPEQDYFADGIVDELIAALSRFRSFAVIARSSSFARKGRVEDVRVVGEELGVRYVLEGSVRRGGNRLRLVAQLVDAADGANLWAQTFEGAVDDVFEFQDRIATAVAAVAEPHIQRAELEHSRRERPESMAAYDLYLRAVAKLYQFTPDANAEAIRLLDGAVAIEPDNGVFLGFLAWALEHRSTMNWPPFADDDLERCLRLAHEAVERAGSDAAVLAHCGLAMQAVGQEYERGLLVARKSVELNPNDTVALLNTGIAELIGGDLDKALALLSRAVAIQPNDAYEAMGAIGSVYVALGQFEEAVAWAAKARAINARYVPSYWSLVAGHYMLGRLGEAQNALQELLQLAPGLTVTKFANTARTKDPQRDEAMIGALRAAGLPEA